MAKSFSLFCYNLLLPLGLACMLPRAVVKMRRRGGRWQDLAQRFGRLPPEKRAALAVLPCGRQRVWIHAVSVGEVGIATKLMTSWLQAHPHTGFLVTTTTPTGHALAEAFAARQPGRVVVLYSPLDLPGVGASLLDQIGPAQVVLVEAEVWPNLVAAARRRGIPVSLVNARLSPRSERRFHQLGGLIRPVFGMLAQVLVQEPEDVARWTALGVAAERVHHTGSIKFDPQGAAPDPAQVTQLRAVLEQAGITAAQPVLLLASTHPGEEVLLAGVWRQLRQTFADLALLIVPRHVERTGEILQALEAAGIGARRRSEPAAGPSEPVLLIDTTGELRAWQALATLVVVGKSFLATGGQNPAEAVLEKKPVLFGPHMENFEALVSLLLRQGGAIQVADAAALRQELARLLGDADARAACGEAGCAALLAHAGATEQTVCRLAAS